MNLSRHASCAMLCVIAPATLANTQALFQGSEAKMVELFEQADRAFNNQVAFERQAHAESLLINANIYQLINTYHTPAHHPTIDLSLDLDLYSTSTPSQSFSPDLSLEEPVTISMAL